MTPLQTELHRLYRPTTTATAAATAGEGDGVRSMVLELVAPPAWRELGRVWQGVQDALGLPAPGIAVSGIDGLQLWFSLAEPVPAAQALAFLQGLQSRFLPEVGRNRLRLMPGPAAPVPALQESTGNWSAFVAPDLAPVFDDTPWLDIEPNEDGQTTLLRALRPAGPAAFTAAMQLLEPPAAVPPASPSATEPAPASAGVAGQDPRQFLARVMNDERVDMALRIEAAKALLANP